MKSLIKLPAPRLLGQSMNDPAAEIREVAAISPGCNNATGVTSMGATEVKTLRGISSMLHEI